MILEKSRTLFFAAAFLSLIPLQAFAASPVVGTERARGLRTLETAPMLFEYHRQTVGDERQFFTYPRRNLNFREEFRYDREKALISFGKRSHEYHPGLCNGRFNKWMDIWI